MELAVKSIRLGHSTFLEGWGVLRVWAVTASSKEHLQEIDGEGEDLAA